MPHARCSKCRGRRTLTQHPDEYRRPPRCGRCGTPMVAHPVSRLEPHWTVDKYRSRVERNSRVTPICYPGRGGCGGYSFPHRRGSGYCWHNPNLTDEDLQRRDRWA